MTVGDKGEGPDQETNPHLDREFRARNAHKIACPVIAAMYKAGWLVPDVFGRITRDSLIPVLERVGCTAMLALFQAVGIAGYTADDPWQTTRTRQKLRLMPSMQPSRYVNIFRMSPGDMPHTAWVQHAVSTTVRDRRYDGAHATSLNNDEWQKNMSEEGKKALLAGEKYQGEQELLRVEDTDPAVVQQIRASREMRLQKWFPRTPLVTARDSTMSRVNPDNISDVGDEDKTGVLKGVQVSLAGTGRGSKVEYRMYSSGLANLLANFSSHPFIPAHRSADRCGEFSDHPPQEANQREKDADAGMSFLERYHPAAVDAKLFPDQKKSREMLEQWQANFALVAFLAAFGREDKQCTDKHPKAKPDIYLTEEDLRRFYLDSEFPELGEDSSFPQLSEDAAGPHGAWSMQREIGFCPADQSVWSRLAASPRGKELAFASEVNKLFPYAPTQPWYYWRGIVSVLKVVSTILIPRGLRADAEDTGRVTPKGWKTST